MNKIVPGGDIDISYDDLQKLLNEFKDQMEILKAKLKEDGNKGEEQPLEEVAAPEDEDDEAELVRELHDLREFVNNNKECIEDFFHIIRNNKDAPHELQGDVKEDHNDD